MIRVPRPAVLDRLRFRHTVIEASAGTGKTFTLEHLVVELVLEGIPLPEILIVTFTTKATLELQARVRGILERLLQGPIEEAPPGAPCWELDEVALARLAAALGALDQATLATIHGFCQRVLQEAALESRALFTREQVDGRALFARAFEACLRTRFTTDPTLRDLLETALSEGWTVEALGRELEAANRERARVHPDLSPLPAHLAAFPQLTDPEAEALAALWKARKVHASTVKAAVAQLARVRDFSALKTHPLGFVLRWDPTQLGSLQKACAQVGDATPFTAWVNAYRALGASPEALLVEGLLPEVRHRLAALKAEEGLFDFDDMVLDVKRALEGPEGPGLIARLRATYRVALIDEFQDTDTAQWDIFRTLFHVDSHRLYLIGDPKQAIYGFRGGDLPTYRRAVATLGGRDGVVRLGENFRSTAPLIAGYNHLLEGLLTGDNTYPEPVACGRPALALTDASGASPAPITVLSLPVEGSGNRALWTRLAHALAAELDAFMATGPRLGEPGKARALTWSDVFILTGKGKEGALVAEALAARGIPSAFFKQEGLFQSPEAEAWRAILEAIAEPWEPTRVARALVTPFFGFRIPELEGLREMGDAHPVRERLRAWGQLAQARRFPALVEAVLRESGILPRLLLQEGGERALTNVQHLGELLAQQALERHGDLDDLLRQLGHWMAGTALPAGENGNVQRLEGRAEAVQILTMHASKGLEAPVVALFALGEGAPSGSLHRFVEGGERACWIGPKPDAEAPPRLQAVREAIDTAAQEEAQRVLYVALTRAEAKLFLPCLWTPANPAKEAAEAPLTAHVSSTYQPLNARLHALIRGGTPRHAALEVCDLTLDAGLDSEAAAIPDLRTWTPPPPLQPPDLDIVGLRSAARARATFSFTSLQKRLERDHRTLEREDPEPDEPLAARPPEALPSGKEMGVLLHGLLEIVDLGELRGRAFEAWWAGAEAFRSELEARLRFAGVEPRWQIPVARLIHQAVATPFPWIGVGARSVAEAPRLIRELDFLTGAPGTSDYLEGSLDALIQFEGRAFILDWKSNTLPAYDADSLASNVRAHYEWQVRIYTLAALRFLGIEAEADYEARFGGVAYVYLRGLPEGGFWHVRPTWDEVQGWLRAVGELTSEVARG